MTRHDTRHRKTLSADPLRAEDANAVAIHHALKPLDRIAREMEAKWGVDRLPELVTPELAAKFGGALGQLEVAQREGDVQAVQRCAANVAKGWQALDTAATQAGHQPPPEDAWPVRIAGQKPGWIVKDPAATKALSADLPTAPVYTLQEVGRLLGAALGPTAAPMVEEAKALFPGATVKEIRPKKPPPDWEGGGDDIPF